jgi:cell division protein FtsZ
MAQAAADPDANIIFGSVVDERMDGEVKITVIATGFARAEGARPRGASPRQATAPMASVVAARREAPPPLPSTSRPVSEARAMPARPMITRSAAIPDEPIPAPRPRTAPVRTSREVTPYQAGEEDQYDIPAFLRRGASPKES